jgi:hypothetical protein
MDQVPNELKVLMGTLIEMKKASGPNSEADYWDLKMQIQQNLSDLSEVDQILSKHIAKFNNFK